MGFFVLSIERALRKNLAKDQTELWKLGFEQRNRDKTGLLTTTEK